MKKIEAIIKPHKIEEIRAELAEIGIIGITAWDVRGFGRQKGHQELYRGSEYQVSFVPKIMMEIVVADNAADDVVRVIRETANSGTIGDGKIFVSTVDHAVRIRTAEVDDDAL